MNIDTNICLCYILFRIPLKKEAPCESLLRKKESSCHHENTNKATTMRAVCYTAQMYRNGEKINTHTKNFFNPYTSEYIVTYLS